MGDQPEKSERSDGPAVYAVDPRDGSPGDPANEVMTAKEVVTALRFSHVIEMQTKIRVNELTASFYALLETLNLQGVLPFDVYEKRRQVTQQREEQRALQNDATVALNSAGDKYQLTDLPQIDCAARMPLCKARCCTLTFPLSAQDLDEGVVRWDYSRPYQIRRRDDDSYCVHNVKDQGGCSIYAQRPAVCRSYDCRNDKRIWIDFEQRIPAPPPTAPSLRPAGP